MPQRLDDLEKRAIGIKTDFQKLERGIEKFTTLAYFIIGAIAAAFTFTSILIGLDYFKYNQDRYEKFIYKTEEIENDFYTKEQINNHISSSAAQTKKALDDFKKCLKEGGWSRCF